jgi:DNA-binding NarL/FixJ family response regulator
MNPEPLPRPIRVAVADDHGLVRAGIGALLAAASGIEVVGLAADGAELIRLVENTEPDVAITDLSMPGMDGLTAIAHLHTAYPQVRLLVLSMNDSVDFIKRAVSKGASGYLLKDAASLELVHAVRTLVASGSYMSSFVARQLLQRSAPTVENQLTERQIEILVLIAKGRSTQQIATDLGLSPKTVDVHRARIMERLQLHDIANLTLYALRHGLVTT